MSRVVTPRQVHNVYTPDEWRHLAEALHADDEVLTEYDLAREPVYVIDDDVPMTLRLKILNQELSCAICLSIIRDTRVVTECMHRFCNECITKCLRTGKKECPTCRSKCASHRRLRPDKKYDEIIRQFYPDVEAYEEQQDEIIESINTSVNMRNFQDAIEQQMAAQQHQLSLEEPSVDAMPLDMGADEEAMAEFVPPPPKRHKVTHFTMQPPVRGPGRAPGVKKRGPGRPPKRRPEEAPGFCPEFLEPDLLTATSVAQNVKRTELVYHFHHVDAHHTQATSEEEIIAIPPKVTAHKPELLSVHLISRKSSTKEFFFSVVPDTPIRALVDHLRAAFKCKTVQLYEQMTGGSPLRPTDVITKEQAGTLYFQQK